MPRSGPRWQVLALPDSASVALPNRPANSEEGGSGAAAAGWARTSQIEVVLACFITYVKA